VASAGDLWRGGVGDLRQVVARRSGGEDEQRTTSMEDKRADLRLVVATRSSGKEE